MSLIEFGPVIFGGNEKINDFLQQKNLLVIIIFLTALHHGLLLIMKILPVLLLAGFLP